MSTAFYRLIKERDDFDVLLEPFAHYYWHKDRMLYDDIKNKYDSGEIPFKYIDIKNKINSLALSRNVFIKDMGYYVYDVIDNSFLQSMHNIFIIRDPKDAIASKYALDKICGYDCTFRDCGYEGLYKIYKKCKNFSTPIIIEAKTLAENPEKVLKTVCSKLNIPYINTLSWGKNNNQEFYTIWGKQYHKSIAESSYFCFKKKEYTENICNNETIKEFYQKSIPFYNSMLEDENIIT